MAETVSQVPETLYEHWSGNPQHDFSYSLASDVDKCGMYTKLTRIQGLAKILESAAYKFGTAVEQAIQQYYLTGADPEKEFNTRWQFFANKELDYSSRDGDWKELLSKGRGLAREFLEHKTEFPDLSKGVFQDKMVLANWMPRANLIYIADGWANTKHGKLLVDMKTSASSYPDDPECYPDDPEMRWPAMDPQLLTGCLVSGIRRVGFLVFVKTKTPKIQWLEAVVRQEYVDGINEWLKEQYEKLIAKKFHRRPGFRFPNQHCTFCDVASACMGNTVLANTLLKQRETKGFSDIFE
jgi:hypothetical protein